MKHFLMSAVLLITVIAMTSFQSPYPPKKMVLTKEITLTILYDNYKYEDGFKNSWGFSCLIEGAGKDPQDVDIIILSHIHGDHTGGVTEFLESRTGIDVYMPQSFPEEFRK